MATLTGIDVSHWQGDVDHRKVAAAGESFIIAKATEGISFVSSEFYDNLRGTRAAGLIPGAYHFLRRGSNAVEQAQHFVRTVGSFSGVIAALDVETSSVGDNPDPQQVKDFVREFERLTKNHPILIYTGLGWYNSFARGWNFAELGPLWHARYRKVEDGPGEMYGGYKAPLIWQYTSSAEVDGVNGNVDRNIFYGGMNALRLLAGLPTRPNYIPHISPTNDEDDMPAEVITLPDKRVTALRFPDGAVLEKPTADEIDAFKAVLDIDRNDNVALGIQISRYRVAWKKAHDV